MKLVGKVISLLLAIAVIVLAVFAGVLPANVALGEGEVFVKSVDGGLGDVNNERVSSMAISTLAWTIRLLEVRSGAFLMPTVSWEQTGFR